MINNDEINKLVKNKRELLFLNENKKISDNDYLRKVTEIDMELDVLREKCILEGQAQQEQNILNQENKLKKEMNHMDNVLSNIDDKKEVNKKINNSKENKMAKEKTVKEVKEKKVSMCSLILKALSLKTIKTVDAVVEKVIEQAPNADKAKLTVTTKNIIHQVKKGNTRFKKYSWDEESFLLTEK